jgi:hypothetical protein
MQPSEIEKPARKSIDIIFSLITFHSAVFFLPVTNDGIENLLYIVECTSATRACQESIQSLRKS